MDQAPRGTPVQPIRGSPTLRRVKILHIVGTLIRGGYRRGYHRFYESWIGTASNIT